MLNTTSPEITLPVDFPAEYYGVYYLSFSAAQADAIHKHGSYAYIWTVDDPEQMSETIMKGADGICSNSPDKVQAYLASQNNDFETEQK